MKRLGVVLIDRHPAIQASIARFLSVNNEMEVLGCFGTVEELLEQSSVEIDVVLVELFLEDDWILRAVEAIRSFAKVPRIVAIGDHNDRFHREVVQQLGLDGYVLKSECNTDLLPLLRQWLPQSGDRSSAPPELEGT